MMQLGWGNNYDAVMMMGTFLIQNQNLSDSPYQLKCVMLFYLFPELVHG